MAFSLEELLSQRKIEQLQETSIQAPRTKKYAVTLGYEKHPNGQPIYTRICKVRIEGLNNPYVKEDEVRPFSRRDKLLAHQSYWDKPLFKVFYRKLLDDIPRRSVFYFDNETALKSWEHACKKLGINNAFLLGVAPEKCGFTTLRIYTILYKNVVDAASTKTHLNHCWKWVCRNVHKKLYKECSI